MNVYTRGTFPLIAMELRRIPVGIWILLLVVGFGLWTWAGFNALVVANESVDAAWAQVETQYQRRVDLIPNLVATVRGAADFEQDTFTAVTEARSAWQSAGSQEARIAAANQLEGALARLLVTVEAYPQLQATQAFRDLLTQLEGTENRIGTARRDYNEAVRAYNLRVRRFPGLLLARLFGYGPRTFFEAAEGSETAPSVTFE